MNASHPGSVFPCIGEADLLDYLRLCRRFREFDVEESRRFALAAVRYYKGDLTARDALVAGMRLENRWYEALRSGKIDYSVYDDDYYICDVWACWVVYSRKYLLSLRSMGSLGGNRSIAQDVAPVRSVVDMGCGFGYTTAGLKEIFPAADVYGTNLRDTLQFRVASEIGQARSFRVVPSVVHIGRGVDLAFASEYFEHIRSPVKHLMELLRFGHPKALIIANAFGARSVGHFNSYEHEGKSVPSKQIGRIFNMTLRDHGYIRVKTKFWNDRPAYWRHG